jgi:hypothetical protein
LTLTLKLLTDAPVFAGVRHLHIASRWLAGRRRLSMAARCCCRSSAAALALEARLDRSPTGLDYYPLAARRALPILIPRWRRGSPAAEDHVFLQGLLEGIAAIRRSAPAGSPSWARRRAMRTSAAVPRRAGRASAGPARRRLPAGARRRGGGRRRAPGRRGLGVESRRDAGAEIGGGEIADARRLPLRPVRRVA